MGFFNFFKGLGQKISSAASSVGKKFEDFGRNVAYGVKDTFSSFDKFKKNIGEAVNVEIKGAKFLTDKLDKYTGGIDYFVPYYSLVKAGIDASDTIRQVATGEQKFGWNTIGALGLDAVSAAISKVSAPYEIRALKGASRTFRSARAAGMGVRQSVKQGSTALARSYIPTAADVKATFKAARAGENIISGTTADRSLINVAGRIAKTGDRIANKVSSLRTARTAVNETRVVGVPSYSGFGAPPTGSLTNLIN